MQIYCGRMALLGETPYGYILPVFGHQGARAHAFLLHGAGYFGGEEIIVQRSHLVI